MGDKQVVAAHSRSSHFFYATELLSDSQTPIYTRVSYELY